MSKYQIITQYQPYKWILPFFLMFHGLFGETVNKTAMSSKPIKSSRTIQKPTISDLQVLGERLKEVIGEPSQNQQFKKGSNSSLSQSLTGLKNNPINLTRQIKKAEFKSKFNVSWNKINDTPVFITGSELNQFSSQLSGAYSAQEIAKEFISVHKEVFQLEDSYSELETVKEFNDRYGKKHVKFQQVYQGIPVWGKTVVSHFEPDGDLYLINARFSPSPKDLDLSQINYVKEQAIQIALDDISTFSDVTEFNDEMKAILSYNSPIGKQYIWINNNDHSPHLIWHVQVRPNAVDNWYYFIDVINGEILEKYNNTQTDGPAEGTAIDLNGESQTVHSYLKDGWYFMIDASRPIWVDGQGDNLPGNPLGGLWTLRHLDGSLSYVYSSDENSWETDQVSAHSNTGSVFQYFFDTFGRQAIDGNGSTIISVVNVTSDGQPMDNAYWNGAYMAYGDGDNLFTPLAGALDVAAHEMTHGIVERTVGLEYKFQSGALNESFADIFGAMVDRDDWQIGEMIIANTDYYSSGALRDLSDPNQGGTTYTYPGWQPAHWDEFLDWDITYDNGGVHYNSGIPNKACYLIAEEIGREKTEQIYYKVLEAEYLNSQATFVDMRLAAILAVTEFVNEGALGFVNSDITAVADAFEAVGIVGEEGSSAPVDFDPVQGEDWIVAINDEDGDHSLVLVDPENGEKSELSNINTQVSTEASNTITVDGFGVRILFINDSNDMVSISPDGTDEQNLTESMGNLSGIWRSVSVSPDNKKIINTLKIGSTILDKFCLWSFEPDTLLDTVYMDVSFIDLYSPTTGEGINSDIVQYADAMDWDPTSNYLIYDAFNSVPQDSVTTFDYWAINMLDVETYLNSDSNDVLIFSFFPPQAEGIHMTNPAFSKTNSNYFVFDYLQEWEGDVHDWIYAVDLFSSDIQEIEYNGTSTSYPRYSPDDNNIIFQRMDNDISTIRKINMENQDSPSEPSSEFTTNVISPFWFVIEEELSVQESTTLPQGFILKQNYPNPFNPFTHVEFQIPYDIQVKVSVTDITGREIRVLENSRFNSGAHRVMWDGRDRFGKNVSTGIYLCRVQAGDKIRTGKMLLLK